MQLWKAYESVLSIVNITLVPYGNARESFNRETQTWEFTCQHGSDECLGNLIHACVIYFYPDIDKHMPFVYCTETNQGDVKTVAQECAQKSNIDFDKIDTCTNTKLGNQLEHQYGLTTEGLQPQHTYVPWVTLNGKHTTTIQKEAEHDLVKLICKTYKGQNIPDACKKTIRAL